MSGLISLVLGIIIACIVAYIVGWSKSKKAIKQSSPAPVYFEAQAQAAVTEDEIEKDDKK